MSEVLTIKVLVFGQLVDIIGKTEIKVEDVNSTEDLLHKLTKLYPALNDIKFRIAINKEIIQEKKALKNDDVVALLPPFSGG